MSKWLVRFALLSIFLVGSIAPGAAAPAVTAVNPETVSVRVGGRPVTITLQGTGLDDIDSISVVKDGRRVDGVTVELRAATKDRRRAVITADESVKPGPGYQLRAAIGKRTVVLPVTVEVVPAAAASSPVAAIPAVQAIEENAEGYVVRGRALGETSRGVSVFQCSTKDIGRESPSELPAQCKLPAARVRWKSASEIQVLDAPGGNVFVQVVTPGGRSKILVGSLYADPYVERTARTPNGYAIIGSGFGTRADQVAVYEAETKNIPPGQDWSSVPERFRIEPSRYQVTARRIDVTASTPGTYVVQVKVRNAKTKLSVIGITALATKPEIAEIIQQPAALSIKGKNFVGAVRVFICRGTSSAPTLPDDCLVPAGSLGVYPTNITVVDQPAGPIRVQVESNGVRTNVMAASFQWATLQILRVEKTVAGYAIVGHFGPDTSGVRVYQRALATVPSRESVTELEERYRVPQEKLDVSDLRIEVRDRPIGTTMVQVKTPSGKSKLELANLYQPLGPPRITKVLRLHPNDGVGYQIQGSGFGYEHGAVTVLQNGTAMPESSLGGVSDTYIDVYGAPVGTFTVEVRTRSLSSGPLATNLGFTNVGPRITKIETKYSPYGQLSGYELTADGIDQNRRETLVVWENGAKLTGPANVVSCAPNRTNCIWVWNRGVRGAVRHQVEYLGNRSAAFAFTHPDKGWLPPRIYDVIDSVNQYEIQGFAFGDSADAIKVYENGVEVVRGRINQVWGARGSGRGGEAARIFVNKSLFRDANRAPHGNVTIKVSLEGQETSEYAAWLRQ